MGDIEGLEALIVLFVFIELRKPLPKIVDILLAAIRSILLDSFPQHLFPSIWRWITFPLPQSFSFAPVSSWLAGVGHMTRFPAIPADSFVALLGRSFRVLGICKMFLGIDMVFVEKTELLYLSLK